MRILALTNLYPSPWLPHRATFNRQQFAALAAMHPMHIIAPVSWTDQLRSKAASPGSRTQIRDGVTVEHPQFLFTPGFWRHRHGQFYLHSVRRSFMQAVGSFGPDVVLAAWAYPDVWAAVQLCRDAGLPLVAKVHGSDVLQLEEGSTRQQQTIDALRAADSVITVSRQLSNTLTTMGVAEDRLHTVYNGVDSSLFAPGKQRAAQPHRKQLLFVGNLVAVKGIDTLINACDILIRRGADIECDLIGQGPLKGELSMQIASLHLQDRVRLLGPRPLAEVADAYRRAAMLVIPSRSEGVPNVMLEAIACGTPVVATRVGGIPEVLDDASLVEPNDPEALAVAIEAMLAAPRVSQFTPRSWVESARAVSTVLESAVTRRKVAA